MTVLTPDRVLLLLMAAAVIAGTILRPGPAEYLAILLVCVFAAVYRLTRNRPDRLFYLACSGALLVAVCATASTWEGLFVAWMAAGVLAASAGITVSARDLPAVLLCAGVTLVLAWMIELANHVLLPLTVIGGITAIILAVMAIRTYRLRKEYAGGAPA
jgi:cell division protein FtsW (lipid II flippase)